MITTNSLNLLRRYVEYMQVQCDHFGNQYDEVRASTSVQELSDLLEIAEAIVNYKEAIDEGANFLYDSPNSVESEIGCDLRVLFVTVDSLVDLNEERENA